MQDLVYSFMQEYLLLIKSKWNLKRFVCENNVQYQFLILLFNEKLNICEILSIVDVRRPYHICYSYTSGNNYYQTMTWYDDCHDKDALSHTHKHTRRHAGMKHRCFCHLIFRHSSLFHWHYLRPYLTKLFPLFFSYWLHPHQQSHFFLSKNSLVDIKRYMFLGQIKIRDGVHLWCKSQYHDSTAKLFFKEMSKFRILTTFETIESWYSINLISAKVL